jgi:hypothetical protein
LGLSAGMAILFYSGNTFDLIEEDVETVENIKPLATSQESS